MATKHNVILELNEGCMWDGGPWEILVDCTIHGHQEDMCKHCHTFRKEEVNSIAYDGTPLHYYIDTFICPYVVQAYNESGCRTTGVCLDCIIEAKDKIKHGHPDQKQGDT